MAGDTSVDMMLNVLPGTLTGFFALNAGLSSINQQFQNMTKSVDTHFGIADAIITSASALLLQFSANAASAFGEYEQGMKIVQAVSGQSAASIAELGQTASEFSVKYRMDIQELTDGLQTLGRAGLKTAQEQTEVLENGLQTAKLEGRDLNSVLEELIQNTALLGGNLKSSDFGEQSKYVNDLAVATSMTAPITTHDVSETLKYSGGIAAAAGANIETEEGKELLEDYMAAIAAFAQKGVKGSIAGTALRAFFNKPATQDSSVLEGLSMIGLKPEYLWEDDQQTMKPISEQISLIQSQMDKKNISQMDRLQIWSKIVGGKMGQQMMKLDGKEIREISKDIKEANSAENLATQSMQTYQSAVKQAGEAGQMAFRAFGEHVAAYLTPIVKILTPILEALANPVISTAAFETFIFVLGQAWKSVSKIFTVIRAEIGMIKALMSGTVVNRDARMTAMGGAIWGVSEEQRATLRLMQTGSNAVKQNFAEANAQTEMMGAKVSTITESVSQEILFILSKTRDRITAIGNAIKEETEAINAKINMSISEFSSKLIGAFNRVNQQISSSATRLNSEFSTGLSTAVTIFQQKMDIAITSSLAKLKTGGIGGFTPFSPSTTGSTSKGQLLASNTSYVVSNPGLAKVMMNSQGQFNPVYQKIVASYNRQAELLEQEIAEIQSEKNILATITFVSRKISKEKNEISKLENLVKSKIGQLHKFYTSRVDKEGKLSIEAEQEYRYRQHQIRLLQEEINLRKRQINMMSRHMAAIEVAYQEQILAMRNGAAVLSTSTTTTALKGGLVVGTTTQPTTTNTSGIRIAPSMNTTSGKGGYDITKNQMFWSEAEIKERQKIIEERKELGRQIRKEQGAIHRDTIAKEEQVRLDEAYNEALAIAIVNMEESVLGKNAASTYYRYNDPAWRSFSRYNLPVLDEKDMRRASEVGALRFSGYAYPGGAATAMAVDEAQKATQASKEAAKQAEATFKSYGRYNLPNVDKELRAMEEAKQNERFRGGAYPAGAMVLQSQLEEEQRVRQENLKKATSDGPRTRKIRNTIQGVSKSLKGATSSVKGFRSAVGSATNFLGGPFFAVLMGFELAMQVWNHFQEEYNKKLEEAVNKVDDMISKQEEAEDRFYSGKHEKGEREVTGWDDEHPDATYEERQQALLDAYSNIYDNSDKQLNAFDENTQQLGIATIQLRMATDALQRTYLDEGDFFSGTGPWSDFWNTLYTSEGQMFEVNGIWDLQDKNMSEKGGYFVDKSGKTYASQTATGDYFTNEDILLNKAWQTGEDYPWLKEFGPILSADIWREGSTNKGIKVILGESGYMKLSDQLSSTGGWDNSAWTRQGYNIVNSFGTAQDQNKLQMGLKNYQKDFSALGRQMRKYEKATGVAPLRALTRQMDKTKNMKKALKNLSVQDPKLVSYIKSLAIKTGMSEQQVLMAAQLQQLQDMNDIANNQVTPRLMNLVTTSYQQVAYGGQILPQVSGSGDGAISAAQNAAAIAALLQVKVESELGKQVFAEYTDALGGAEGKYKTPEQFMAKVKAAHNADIQGKLPENEKWLLGYYDNYMNAYARVNAQVLGPNRTQAQIDKFAADFMAESKKNNASSGAMLDTLRKGLNYGVTNQILAAYDSAGEDDGGGSGGGGGGSGSGNKDKDKDTGTKKERVDLVLCNKKEIPKLNVNLFKKAPSFTILNKNFKLRDIKVNTQDKPKAVLASIKNAIIDVQKRTDPKIIQDEQAEYDPVAATDGNQTPSGSTGTTTDE